MPPNPENRLGSQSDDTEANVTTPLLSSAKSTEVHKLQARYNTTCPVTVEPVIVIFYITTMASTMMDTQFFYSYYAQQAGIPNTQDKVRCSYDLEVRTPFKPLCTLLLRLVQMIYYIVT